MDSNAEIPPDRLRKSRHCLAHEIRSIGRQRRVGAGKINARRVLECDLKTIDETQRSHERLDVVEPVGTPPENPEREVDFGWGVNCHAPRKMTATPSTAKEKIIVAIDAPDADAAKRLADPLLGEGCLFKIGLQLFTAEGPSIVREFKKLGARVFLDLKFHDIPNTAKEAIHSAAALGVEMTTIHLCGGPRMVADSVAAAADSEMLVLGVTVLTSMDAESLGAVGVSATPEQQVVHLAGMGRKQGLRGVVASPREILPLRENFGNDLVIVTPGVRPAGSDIGDQKRVMTPAEAVRAGADFLVIGRPITSAPSPVEALRAIAAEMDGAR
jgi:orotidine-5'-phosphate decarboxylase